MSGKKTKPPRSANNLYRLKLPASSENLDIIRKFIEGIAGNMGFSEESIYQIELAVDEACANVITHAYRGENSGEKIIHVTVKQKKDRIEIAIADKGAGFDPARIKSPNMEEYLKKMKPGGLGVHLIKSLMDDVRFHIRPGVRNEVRMVKLLKG